MRKATLTRGHSTDEGTFGVLVTDSGYRCMIGELPDRGNQHMISRIPEGVYTVNWYASGRPSMKGASCYHVDGVKDRDGIEIHRANLMGDVRKGWVSQLEGCLAPGTAVEVFAAGTQYSHNAPPLPKAQRGVVHTDVALASLENDMRREDGQQESFELTIL
jgi:hypothetical protein